MDIKILDKEVQTVSEVATHIRKVDSDKRKPAQQSTYDISRKMRRINTRETRKLMGELRGLDIVRLTDEHIVKIADLLPQTKQELESIFTATKTTIKQEDQDKILAIVKEFV